MTLNNKKILTVVLEYDFFRDISEERRQKMLATDYVEWRVYIPREQQENLTDFEKERLEGFMVTETPPVKVKTFSKKELFPSEMFDKKELYPPEMPVLVDLKKQEKFDKKVERKRLKRIVPRKIGKVNTKKKGGR